MSCLYNGNCKKLCDNNECMICYNNSLASYDNKKVACLLNENPRNIFKNSGMIKNFICYQCNHQFKIRICDITSQRQSWCQFCANKLLCNEKNCYICYNKSLKSILVKFNNLNIIDKDASLIFKNSNILLDFECNDCNHIIQLKPNNINYNHNCGYCSIPTKKLCNNDNCNFCFNKSFASYKDKEKVKCIIDVNPREICKYSHTKYNFICNICFHKFEIAIKNITKDNNWCCYCSNTRLCDIKDCFYCFNKSFGSIENINILNSLIDDNPNKIFKYSNKKFKFKCYKCDNIFEAIISSISMGQYCPYCKNKSEQLLYEYLLTIFVNVERQKKFDDLYNRRRLSYDFYIDELKILIELDGIQHFTNTGIYKDFNKIRYNDNIKMKYVIENNYNLIRIYQPLLYKSKYNWKKDFEDNINSIKLNLNLKKIYYICCNNEYKYFKENFLENSKQLFVHKKINEFFCK